MISAIIFIFSLLVYGMAFYVCHKNRQNSTVYFVYLVIQVLFLLWYLWEKSIPSQSDPAGSGMAAGILALIAIALQIGMTLLTLLTLIVRQATKALLTKRPLVERRMSGSGWISFSIIALIAGIAFFFLFTDYRSIFLMLTSGTNEQKLVLQDSIMYNRNGKPFTGTAYLKGYFKTSVAENGEGIRVSQYKDGRKDGTEKMYSTSMIILVGDRTEINSISHYRNGEKHGLETIYYRPGKIIIEANYANGKLNGLYREFYYPGYNQPPKIKKEVQYANGEVNGFCHTYSLEEQSTYAYRNFYRPADGCLNTTKYNKDGEIEMYYEFDRGDGNVILCKKRVKGKLIEIFNKATGLDRCEEFNVSNAFYVI